MIRVIFAASLGLENQVYDRQCYSKRLFALTLIGSAIAVLAAFLQADTVGLVLACHPPF